MAMGTNYFNILYLQLLSIASPKYGCEFHVHYCSLTGVAIHSFRPISLWSDGILTGRSIALPLLVCRGLKQICTIVLFVFLMISF